MMVACYGGLLHDGCDLLHLSSMFLIQSQQRNCWTSHGRPWAPKCADFNKENLHAFYQSCPKPEAYLKLSTVESFHTFKTLSQGINQWIIEFTLVALFGFHYPQQPFGLARPGQLCEQLNNMVACVEERASLSLFISQQVAHHTQTIVLMALDIDCGATVESTAKQNHFIVLWTASCGLAPSL